MAMIVNEKTFERFSDFFSEIRQCIVDEMEPADRVRFTRCSKSSAKEAKNSKNYIYGLEVSESSKNYFTLQVQHGKKDEDFKFVGFVMKFNGVYRRKYKTCEISKGREVWREELDDSTDMFQLAGDYIKLLLKSYQNTIKHVVFKGDTFKNYDFEIDSMKSLTNLEIDGSMNIAQFLTKLKRPLYNLKVHGGDREALARCEQVYQVKHIVTTSGQIFSYEQMLQFSTISVSISIGSLTEENISNIIQLWQNGKLIRNKVRYKWSLRESSFAFEVLRLLGVSSEGLSQSTFEVEINHNDDVGKVAKLSYTERYNKKELEFLTYKPCGKEECTCSWD